MGVSSSKATPQAADGKRLLLGACLGGKPWRLTAAVVGVYGRGFDLRLEVGAPARTDLPEAVERLLDDVVRPEGCTTGQWLDAQNALAKVQSRFVADALNASQTPAANVLALGWHDPGLWRCDASGVVGYAPLSNGDRLAESTGLSVVDAFPARDMAQGGQGGPILTTAQWLMLRHPFRTRLVVELGRTFRMSYFPAGLERDALDDARCFPTGPGGDLLDALARRATSRPQSGFDEMFAWSEQGKISGRLLERWLTLVEFDEPAWRPHGVPIAPFIAAADELQASPGDALRTAFHFTAECVRLARVQSLPPEPIDEVVLVGGGRKHATLVAELRRCFGELPMPGVDELHLADSAFEPASAALTALLHLDQIPANLPRVTGADVPRILGCLHPGTPQNWVRLLRELHGQKPVTMSLRSAL